MPAYQDPDDKLVVLFKFHAKKNEGRSLAEGRPIYEDEEICEIRVPGSRDVKVFPANAFCGWIIDPQTGEQHSRTYADRFLQQYRQFQMHATQTKSGTPLEHVPFLTDARRAELRASNVYTLESLADIEGVELKNLGPGGRDMKNQAVAFIDASKSTAPVLQLQAELEAIKARNAILEEDAARLKEIAKAKAPRPENAFEEMSPEQLREYITAQTGQAPQGNNSHKTLVRLALEAKTIKAA